MKKIFSFILILTLLAANLSTVNALAEPLKGSVVENNQYQRIEDELFTGKVESLNRKRHHQYDGFAGFRFFILR